MSLDWCGATGLDTGLASKTMSLFSKIQRVFLKGRDKEERQRDLRIDLDLLSGIGPLGRQVFEFNWLVST